MSLIKHRLYTKLLNELHLPTNWLYNFVRRQKLKCFGQITRHNRLEKATMQGMVAGKRSRGKPRQRYGRKTSQIHLVRWQQQAEWRRTGINFAETSGQRRPHEDAPRRSTQKYFSHHLGSPQWQVICHQWFFTILSWIRHISFQSYQTFIERYSKIALTEDLVNLPRPQYMCLN